MGNLFKGLVLGVLGVLLWIIASVLAAVGSVAEGSDDPFASPLFGSLMVVGFAVMVLGPFLFWVVAPIVSLVRRHSHGRDRRA